MNGPVTPMVSQGNARARILARLILLHAAAGAFSFATTGSTGADWGATRAASGPDQKASQSPWRRVAEYEIDSGVSIVVDRAVLEQRPSQARTATSRKWRRSVAGPVLESMSGSVPVVSRWTVAGFESMQFTPIGDARTEALRSRVSGLDRHSFARSKQSRVPASLALLLPAQARTYTASRSIDGAERVSTHIVRTAGTPATVIGALTGRAFARGYRVLTNGAVAARRTQDAGRLIWIVGGPTQGVITAHQDRHETSLVVHWKERLRSRAEALQ